jgi:cold shock CspA family protein
MTRARESFNKKEQEKSKLKKKKDKEQRKEERKATSTKGKSLDDMIAYVDANGNIVSTPPDPSQRQEIKIEDIKIQTTKKEDVDPSTYIRKGRVTFFNDDKGYGFIKDLENQQSLFVHINDLSAPVKENDIVIFEAERGPKGPIAVRVSMAPKVVPPPPPPTPPAPVL